MGKIFCIIGKSGSGKDTVFSELIRKNIPGLRRVVMHTTRPMRVKETEGVEYHFTDDRTLQEFEAQGKVLERRSYNTVHGIWSYFTVDSEIDLSEKCDYIMIGTADVVEKLCERFGDDSVIVIYLVLDDRERLSRCINRESQQKTPDYSEVCRRYLADEKDFPKERTDRYKHIFCVDSSGSVDENASACEKIIKEYMNK